MTKREICERLLKTSDYLAAYEKLLLKDNCPFDADDLGACADTLRDLLLDLAAPEEEKPEREEKHPGVAVPVNEKYPATCLKCGGEAEIVDNMFGTSDDWAYCPKCGCAYRIKRGKDL